MRWLVGLLLVFAAVLKAVELVTVPTVALMHSLGPYFLPLEIGVELAVGLLILSGLYWRKLRWFVLLLFAAFAGYSLYLAVSGATSCGCFGPLHVNPWWTFGLDCAVALGLLASALFERRSPWKELESSDTWLPIKVASRRRAVAVVMGIAIIFTAMLFRYSGQRTAAAGGLASPEEVVILEPEEWIGTRLPIADSIDIDLSHGEWVMLLHRHDCPVCQEEVPRYEQRSAAGERVALVEVPPYRDFEAREKACHYGRLKKDHQWFVQTPIEVRLENGVVMAVKGYGH